MFEALFQEIGRFPSDPFIICGDFNCHVQTIDVLSERLQDGRVHDIAACPHLTGQEEGLRTCLGHGSKEHTRRDFVLLSGNLMSCVRRVSVDGAGGFDVHLPLVVDLAFPNQLAYSVLRVPQPFTLPTGRKASEWRDLLEAASVSISEGAHDSLMQALEA
eukprot:3049683-Alexandrium_andersonii.AAC.1